jgi:hypothetical protein
MLIRTQHRPPLRTPLVFKIGLPEEFGCLNGRGEIVRHATTGQGSVDGVAVRFVSFAGDGAQQLQDYLESMTTEPEPGPSPGVEIKPVASSVPATQPKPEPKAKSIPEITIEFE